MNLFNKTGKRILLVFVLASVATFLFGVIAFNWYLSTDDFAAQLETMRSKLKQRGIRFGSVSVGRLGQIELTDFQVDLGELGTISLATLTGKLEFSSLLSGEVKTILDVTDIIGQYLKLRFEKKLTLRTGSKVQFSFGGDIRALRTGKGLNGDIYLTGCKLHVQKIGATLALDDVTLPISTPGPVVSFPGVKIFFDDRVTTLTGSIRNILRNPEFVDTTLTATRSSLMKPISDTLKLLQDQEIARKVVMDGSADIKFVVNGPILSPQLDCSFDIPDYVLDFQGTHRNIKITFAGFKGNLAWLGTSGNPHFTIDIKADSFLYTYSEIQASHLPSLHLRGSNVICRALYKKRLLSFQQLVANLYGGKVAGKINCDFNFSPLSYTFALVGKGLNLNQSLADFFNNEKFINGNVDFILNGTGKTLKIEYILAEGKASIKDFSVIGFPDVDGLHLPELKKRLPGLKFNNSLVDFKIDHGFFDIMKMHVKSDNAVLDSFTHVDLLTLDMNSGFSFSLKDSFLNKYSALETELPEKRLDIIFSGRVMKPHVTYIPATVIKQ